MCLIMWIKECGKWSVGLLVFGCVLCGGFVCNQAERKDKELKANALAFAQERSSRVEAELLTLKQQVMHLPGVMTLLHAKDELIAVFCLLLAEFYLEAA